MMDSRNLVSLSASVLVVVGPTCAGKSTFGKYVAESFGFNFIEVSSVLRTYSTAANKDLDLFHLARMLEKKYGTDFLAKRIMELYDLKEGYYVISGFRMPQEYHFIKQHVANTIITFIDANESLRFNRSLERVRSDMPRDLEKFRLLDQAQQLLGLIQLAQCKAEVRLENNGTLDDFFSSIGNALAKLKYVVVDK